MGTALLLAVLSIDAVLMWVDNSSNESGFKVQRQLNGATFADVATLATAANTVSVTDTTLTGSTLVDNVYCYRLYSFNSAGNSAFSNTACKTIVKLETTPIGPSNLTIQ
jgi:peptidyl-Asp metalloendopeptidase